MAEPSNAPVVKKGDWKVTMNPDDIYRNPMDIAWTFAYEFGEDKVQDLYNRAKQNQWDSDEYLPWDHEVDPSKPLIADRSSIYHKIPFFSKLNKSQQETFTAHSTAQLLSQFLHGEQGALMTAACVTHSVPDAGATLKSDRHEKVMIGMNMIVESLALGAFNNMYRTTTCPLLKKLTFNVMRDESRHVSFGHIYLGPVFAKMHKDDREEMAQFAFDAVNVLASAQMQGGSLASRADPGFLMVLDNSGIDRDDFFKGMEEAEADGISQALPPGQIHALDDLMMPAIARVGLITERTRPLYEEAGIPISEDLRVLEAMEGGHPVEDSAAAE